MCRLLLALVILAGTALIRPAPALADFEIGVVEGTGKTKDEAVADAYRRAVGRGLKQEYGIEAGPLSNRITQRSLNELRSLFQGTGNGTTAQRAGGVSASFFFNGDENAFDAEIGRSVKEVLKGSGSRHILTAFVVTSTRKVILDAEAEWLKGRGEYSGEAAEKRADARLGKAGDEFKKALEDKMSAFGIPFTRGGDQKGFNKLLLDANSSTRTNAFSKDGDARTTALEEQLRETKANRAAFGVVDLERIESRNGLTFVEASVSGDLYELDLDIESKLIPFKLNVRGMGRDLDQGIKSVLDIGARDIVLRKLLAGVLRSADGLSNGFSVRLCGPKLSMSELLFFTNTLEDIGRVTNPDPATYFVADPMAIGATRRPYRNIIEFAVDLEQRFAARKWPVGKAADTVTVGRCK